MNSTISPPPGTLPRGVPPLDKYNLIANWMATVIYGMNILLYGACLYILCQKSRGIGPVVLVSTCTVLFGVATMHAGSTVRQFIDAFIDSENIPGGSLTYWFSFTNTQSQVKAYAYVIADCIQDYVLIWRLYVVWGNNWMVAIFPFLCEIAHTALALYDTIMVVRENALLARAPTTSPWVLVLIVNIMATTGIAGRLWYMGRRVAPTTSVRSGMRKYVAAITTMMESGVLFTSSVIALIALYWTSSPLLQPAVNIATQLAVTTPFLIIVRIGFGLTHGFGSFGKARYQYSQSDGSTTNTHLHQHKSHAVRVNVYNTTASDTCTSTVDYEMGTRSEDRDSTKDGVLHRGSEAVKALAV